MSTANIPARERHTRHVVPNNSHTLMHERFASSISYFSAITDTWSGLLLQALLFDMPIEWCQFLRAPVLKCSENFLGAGVLRLEYYAGLLDAKRKYSAESNWQEKAWIRIRRSHM